MALPVLIGLGLVVGLALFVWLLVRMEFNGVDGATDRAAAGVVDDVNEEVLDGNDSDADDPDEDDPDDDDPDEDEDGDDADEDEDEDGDDADEDEDEDGDDADEDDDLG